MAVCFVLIFLLLNSALQFLHDRFSCFQASNWQAPRISFFVWEVLVVAISFAMMVLCVRDCHNDHPRSSNEETFDEITITRKKILVTSKRVTPSAVDQLSPADGCPICLIPLSAARHVRVTACQHIFCSPCLEHFVANCKTVSAFTCPLCRGNLVPRLIGSSADGTAAADWAQVLRPVPAVDLAVALEAVV
jgi:hypothetical protein